MDILIKTATSEEVQRWGSPPGRIRIEAEKLTLDPGNALRPMAVGPNHFLATATVVEPALGLNEKRGTETVDVVGQVVTINRRAVAMSAQEIFDRDKVISRDDFLDRFTSLEITAILASVDPNVVLWLEKSRGHTTIDLAASSVDAAMQVLVVAGLITAGRKTTILTP